MLSQKSHFEKIMFLFYTYIALYLSISNISFYLPFYTSIIRIRYQKFIDCTNFSSNFLKIIFLLKNLICLPLHKRQTHTFKCLYLTFLQNFMLKFLHLITTYICFIFIKKLKNCLFLLIFVNCVLFLFLFYYDMHKGI